MENKQTAVEFLLRELRIEDLAKSEQLSVVYHIINQAKAMEKEQIIDAYKYGIQDEYVIGAEQYYNETYGKETDRNASLG